MRNFFHVTALAVLALICFAVLMLEAAASALVPESGPRLMLPRSQLGYVTVDLEPFENVVATGTASARWDKVLGRSVDRIILGLAGGSLTKAMLTSIKLYANEKVIFDDTGTITDQRMVYRGITASAAYLTLDFNEIRAHSDMNKVAGALDCPSQGIRKLAAEVVITGATTPALTAQAMLHETPNSGDPRFNALIAKVLRKTWNFGAAGEFPFPLSLVRHPLSLVKRVHLSGATVTAARVKKTNTRNQTDEIFKATDAQNDQIQIEYGRTPQTNLFTIDFMPDGDVRESLPLADALGMEWYITVSGAGNVVVITELLDPLSNN